MGFGRGVETIDLTDIFKSVRECDVLSHYLGISSIPCIISSPFRKDEHPSFGIWTKNGQHIGYTDLATRETGDLIDLLKKLWNTDFNGVLQKLREDLPNITASYGQIQSLDTPKKVKTYNRDTQLQCKVREWRDYDLAYWEIYGISKKWLEFGDIYPISQIILTKTEGQRYVIPAEKYAYAYVERKDNKISLKIYQPFSKTFKWSNKHDSSVWDLWTKLPEKGDKLIITSSRKDALCIWENTGIPALSLQAESYLPKQHVVQQLLDRFTNVYILYDNDYQSSINYGRILGAKMAAEFGLIQIEIPDEYQSKDSSDLCKNYGRQQVKDLINQLT